MEKEKIINNIIIKLLKLYINDNNYMISSIRLLDFIKNLENYNIETLKVINKNLKEQLEG